MPINLQNEQNIATGWPGPPQLQGRDLGHTLASILAERLARDKMTQESIADTIKNIREERQSGAYLDAMKAAGLVPQDFEAGGAGGARYGTALAVAIDRKRKEDAAEAHRKFMEGLAGRRVGIAERRGHGSDLAADVPATDVPEDYYGLSVKPGAPSQETTRVIDGVVHVRTPKGGWKPGPKWMQQGAGQDGTAKPTDIAKAVKEELGLQETLVEHEKRIAKERAANIEALKPDVPYSQSDVYNTTKNRLEQLKAMPGMPSTAPPGASPTPPPADTAAGHAPDYGTTGSDDTSGVRVKVMSPDGKVGTLPASQLQDALVMGYKQVP